jgi:hypothetical protein
MNNGLEWWIGDNGFVESPFLGNIFNDRKIKFALRRVWMGLLDFVGLFFRSNSSHNRVIVLKQKIQDMGGNEATATLTIILADAIVSSRRNNEPVRSTRVISVSVFYNGEFLTNFLKVER